VASLAFCGASINKCTLENWRFLKHLFVFVNPSAILRLHGEGFKSVSNLFASRLPKAYLSQFFAKTCCWLTIVFIAGFSATAAEQHTGQSLENYLKRLGYEPIPLKRDHANHLLVSGQIDGKSRDIMVDTGCSFTTVDSDVARKLKTLGSLGVRLEDSFLGTLTNAKTCLMTVKLGDAIFTNQPAHSKALNAGGHSDSDCLLGCDFLFRNFCLIDCTSQKLYVRGTEPPKQAVEALNESLRRSGYHEIKLEPTSGLVMTASGSVNGHPVKLLLDTGWVWTTVDTKQMKRLGIEKQFTTAQINGIGKIGSAWLDRTRLKSFELGDVSFKNLDVGVADLSGWNIGKPSDSSSDFDGILGPDLLAYNRGLIDCHARKLWLQP
jgi:predicted aspartyl protease